MNSFLYGALKDEYSKNNIIKLTPYNNLWYYIKYSSSSKQISIKDCEILVGKYFDGDL